MKAVLYLAITVMLLESCFECSKNGSKDLGNGFEYYYLDNSLQTANIYFNDSGIFPYQCVRGNWDDKYIFIECFDNKKEQTLFFIVNKAKYKKEPNQFESKAIAGPLNYDSLNKSGFFESTQIGYNRISLKDLK